MLSMSRSLAYLYASAALAAVTLLVAACSVPFSYETDKTTVTIDAQTDALDDPKEEVFDVPQDQIPAGLEISSVTLHYSIATDSTEEVEVELYVSDDTATDNQKSEDDETIVSGSISQSNSPLEGSSQSSIVAEVVNTGQKAFVIGGKITSGVTSFSGKLTIEVSATIEGSYSPGG